MEIFVFGSNLAGKHGKGAALDALREHGAKYGQGEGLQGNSYGIPTKDEKLRPLSLARIERHIGKFLQFASEQQQEMTFKLTRVGCGLAGYKDKQIGPMFQTASTNVILPTEWRQYHVSSIGQEANK